jgi:HK97 family phage major capsid protein
MNNYPEALKRRSALKDQMGVLLTAAETGQRELTAAESGLYDTLNVEVKLLAAQIEEHETRRDLRVNGVRVHSLSEAGYFPGIGEGTRQPHPANGERALPQSQGVSAEATRLMADLSSFYRGEISASSDSPLIVGSGGLSGTVPTDILSVLPTHFRNDAFERAGATIYSTDNTQPLVKPIISAGPAPDEFSETQSATESHPMQVDTFTFNGQKFSRLVKVSEEALMNAALDLPGEITAELSAAVANAFTSVITTAMMSALHSNADTLVDSSTSDPYYSVLALINAVPPRWDDPSCCFMGSRAMRLILQNARAVDSGLPLLSPTDGTVLSKRFVVNDACTRLVYGNFAAGAFIRKSPYFLQVLLEAYAASGERGFKATQWVDQKFLASVSAIDAQPLYYTHLDVAGS